MHALAVLAAGLSLCGSPPQPPAPPSRPSPAAGTAERRASAEGRPAVYLGGHLPEISGWTAAIYANQLLQGRAWMAAGTLDPLASGQLDGRGNPTVDGRLLFLEGRGAGPDEVVAGTYQLSFNGQAKLRLGGYGLVQNVAYQAATNTTTAEVVITQSGDNVFIDFTDAWRKADHTADASGHARGITNPRLMAPGHAWPADYWRKEVVAMRAAFGLMRFSAALGPSTGGCHQATGVVASCDTSWSTRSRPGFLGYSDRGMPWEDTVLFANLTGMDLWINLPIRADDDYLTKVFQLLKYGSDGDLPYTAQTHDPASWTPAAAWYPGLLPGRKVYVEFTNELFTYFRYGDPQGQAEIAAGDPHHLAWDGKTKHPGDRWGAWNAVRIGLLARRVWGDPAMQETIRVVYANQGDWGGWDRHRTGLEYIDKVWGPGSPYPTVGGFANPRRPVSYYLHDISGSFYLRAAQRDGVPLATSAGTMGTLGERGDGTGLLGELKRSLSVDGRGQPWEHSIFQLHETADAMAARYGITFTSYETGIEIFKPGAAAAAWSDPQMRRLYYLLLDHLLRMPHADVPVQTATVRGVHPTFELSRSYAAADGFPWPRSGRPAPTPMWQAVLDLAAGR